MTQEETLKILKMGKNVFLTGPAGSGKTHVLNEYISFLRNHDVDVAVTASTGIAATHLKGTTVHSWAGIGIKDTLTDYDLDALEQKAYLWKRFDKVKVLVIDEISMLSSFTLESIDKVAKLFKRNNAPFGGLQVIFSGDFFQLPPIEKKRYLEPEPNQEIAFEYEDSVIQMEEEEEVSTTPFAFKSHAWKDADLHICYLSEQFRQDDDVLSSILDEIREGSVSEKSLEILNEKKVLKDDDEITKLFTHNINVNSFNDKKIRGIDDEESSYKMISKGKDHLVQALKKGCLVPEDLLLKKGALVMFVKNNPSVGYVNGTVGRVVSFSGKYPTVETDDGRRFIAEPQTWSVDDGGKILAEISQVPLKLAWAVTVHKSQGMTLDKAVIDLSGAFVEGQGYVALSRVKSLDGIFLKGFNPMALEVHAEILRVDDELKNSSKSLFDDVKGLKKKEYEERHKDFLESVGAKKFKVRSDSGKKLSTQEITQKLLKEKKSMKEIVSERGLKMGTILTHIEKLFEEGEISSSDIRHLNPGTDKFDSMIDVVQEEIDKLEEFKLTPVFKSLGGKYTFDDIRFARIFCL